MQKNFPRSHGITSTKISESQNLYKSRLVAEIPTERDWNYVDTIKIGEDSTIVMIVYQGNTLEPRSVVKIFQYDGSGGWSKALEWTLVERYDTHALSSAAVTLDTIVVGFSYFKHSGKTFTTFILC